jgi:hypothetical protein
VALPSVAELLPQFEARIGVAPGSLSGVDLARAEACLSDASLLVTAAAGDDLGDPADSLAVTITLNSARRAYLNPSGAVSETVGPYSVRYGDDSPNGVYLTSSELAALHGLGSAHIGIGTISVYRDDYADTLWVYDQDGVNGGDPIAFETRPLL